MSSFSLSYHTPSPTLFGLKKELNDIIKLHKISKLPKVLMLSGEKGIGKFTLAFHFLANYFDKENYNFKDLQIQKESIFSQQFEKNIFSNIIYVEASTLKIEDIRKLKADILKTLIVSKERFIIIDDVELLNKSCINALLKIIEEPTINNYFILINNKKKKIIETIHSRTLEFKIILNNQTRTDVIKSLIKRDNLIDYNIDYQNTNISPGNFLIFNDILSKNEINLADNYLNNFSLLLSLYKKEKNYSFIDLILYLTEIYFSKALKKKDINLDKLVENKSFVVSNIDKFLLFNLNQNSLINAINNKFSNE
ncbi:AAA family ATPase [Candidatus Pelagibacter bacterium]|nr:AAA family ATPase [Candidatus Pelagibacter bacterium]